MNHAAIKQVYFSKNSNDFVVNEIPLYEFSGSGEHLILHVRKKDLTTWAMLRIFSEISGAKIRDFGYAGLKDKDGMTTQYISIHKHYAKSFENFSHPNIKILNMNYHDNKIKIGHLKGNRFFIRVKKTLPSDALKLSFACEKAAKEGYPNYFGYQRFGKDGDNFELGKAILIGEKRERNPKLREFLISAYQSELFNRWLAKRIEISKYFESFNIAELQNALKWDRETIKELKNQPQFFKLLKGDVCHHYPHGKAFLCDDLDAELKRFLARDITITGFLAGSRAIRACGLAGEIDSEIVNDNDVCLDRVDGSRRFAWNFIEDFKYKYIEEEAWFEMDFTLTKGAYATVVLEEILCRNLDEKSSFAF
ncbi:MAG: tRNA pseudouridine(13) synthase TruD [Campylobacteraceae bacterium]|jgi:tRNA pseudouridine13 synthase|nr:tRNA pseudouridine(13) synthase TruD [Campylobacteraceae bacterium]